MLQCPFGFCEDGCRSFLAGVELGADELMQENPTCSHPVPDLATKCVFINVVVFVPYQMGVLVGVADFVGPVVGWVLEASKEPPVDFLRDGNDCPGPRDFEIENSGAEDGEVYGYPREDPGGVCVADCGGEGFAQLHNVRWYWSGALDTGYNQAGCYLLKHSLACFGFELFRAAELDQCGCTVDVFCPGD